MDAIVRRARAIRRLPAGAACVLCGESDPVVLEEHHVAGITNDTDATIVLCLNHHRQQTASQRGVGVGLDSGPDRTLLDRLVSWLRGLGLFFAALGQQCVRSADRLAALARGLDAELPAWRALPEAM